MATRMQQRRGTAAQWTSADPVLAAGEIGFEIDTNQFKMGDGVNAWSDLSYFKNLEDLGGSLDDYVPVTSKGQANGVAELDNTGKIPAAQIPALVGLDSEIATAVQNAVNDLVDGAPSALNTLNEIAAAVNDDENFAAWVAQAMAIKAPLGSPNFTGVPTAPTAGINVNNTQIATTGYVKAQGYLVPGDLATIESDIDGNTTSISSLDLRVDSTESDITRIDSSLTTTISDLSETTSDVSSLDGRLTTAEGALETVEASVSSHSTSISSIESDVSGLQTTVGTHGGDIGTLQSSVTSAESDIAALQGDLTTAESNISTLQADLDTAEATLATTTSNYNAHDAKTTTVHGIADTAALATKSYADTAGTNAVATANTYTDTAAGLLAPKASPTFTGTVTIPAGASISGFAPLASPALTGTPTAPTASAGTNTTQVATTAYVRGEVSALVASAPGALDTLNELATALGNDASFSTTITTALAAKAPLASPTFTGTVTLPSGTVTSGMILDGTIVDGDINASAAIAQSKISGLTASLDAKANKKADISSKSADYTFVSSDVNMIIEHNSGSAATFTIPSDNAFWEVGQRLELLQVSSGRITVAGAAGVTVNGTPGLKTRAQWSGATIIKRAANTFVVIGDLSA